MKDITVGRRGLLGLAGLGLAELVLAGCGPQGPAAQWSSSQTPGASGSARPSPSPTLSDGLIAGSGKPVHVRLYENDGGVYGVGMPIIAYLSAQITDAQSFTKATKVSVNGSEIDGAWYFQRSGIYRDYPVEAHYRPQDFWPAHAMIRMDLPIQGLSAGTGLVFDNSLTLDLGTAERNITQVDGKTERMIVTSDGEQVFSFPVSLGKASTPTFSGIKIVMEKYKIKEMINTTPGQQYDLKVPWSVRITNSGEFIHAASWNGGNIGVRSTSHGCTNLGVTNAEKYFNFARIGDVTVYTNTGGPAMPSWDGYGDWNLPWTSWQIGGLVPTK